MLEIMNFELGNASSLLLLLQASCSSVSKRALKLRNLSYPTLLKLFFTSGGSESSNTVANISPARKGATSAVEHPSVLESLKARASSHCLKGDRCGFR